MRLPRKFENALSHLCVCECVCGVSLSDLKSFCVCWVSMKSSPLSAFKGERELLQAKTVSTIILNSNCLNNMLFIIFFTTRVWFMYKFDKKKSLVVQEIKEQSFSFLRWALQMTNGPRCIEAFFLNYLAGVWRQTIKTLPPLSFRNILPTARSCCCCCCCCIVYRNYKSCFALIYVYRQ